MIDAKNARCEVCNKSNLSLLLLRPSPIATTSKALVPPGSEAVASDAGLVSGLIPTRAPTESRTVLRLLRAGYVHVYIPSPPPPMKNWQVFRVTDNADLYDEGSSVFGQNPLPDACSRFGHNKAGMRTLSIPMAHNVSTVWIAYSANLWNDKLRAQNQANPKVMQQVSLAGGSPYAYIFKPTADNLKSKILECALTSLKIDGDAAQDFQFNPLSPEGMAEQLINAAANHPKTKDKELAVVLADPVGYATELNALRIRRHHLARKEIEKPENAHPLNSSNALMGLKQTIVDAEALDSYEKVSPLQFKEAFDRSTSYPPGTIWHPLTAEDRKTLQKRASSPLLIDYRNTFSREDLGRVIYPDHDARAATWTKEQVAKTWDKLAPHYDEGKRAAWIANFEAKMKAEHYLPLAKYENDWLAAALDIKTIEYFVYHFDPEHRNPALDPFSPGTAYSNESFSIYQPAPITTGAVLDTYLAMLDKPITDKTAVVLRALVGNQQEVIALVHTQLTGDSGADGMRERSYDFLKGVLSLDKTKKIMGLKQYSWMGDVVSAFSVGQLTALGGGITSAALRSETISAGLQAQFRKIQYLWGVQQAVEYMAGAAFSSSAPKMPILLTMRVSAKEALAVLRARPSESVGSSKRRIKQQGKAGNKITLTLLTDTEALKAVQGDAHKLMKDPNSGSVKMGQSREAVLATSTALRLNEQQFLRLYATQSTLGTQAVNAVRQSLETGAGAQVRAISMTMEGRLAIGSIIVQGIGLMNSLQALSEKEGNELRDAWYGMMGSTAGVCGGLLEMWAVAAEASIKAKAGEEAVKKSMGVMAIRIAMNFAGAAGGIINMNAAWAKAKDAREQGDIVVSRFYAYSSVAFSGTILTSGAMAAGVAADTMLARGVGGAVVRSIAARVGAQGVVAVVGGTALTVSGIGLVLFGAGMVFQITAEACKPSEIQRWMSRSYFGKAPKNLLEWDGKRDDMFTKGDWKAEFDALQAAIKAGGKEPEPKAPTKAVAAS